VKILEKKCTFKFKQTKATLYINSQAKVGERMHTLLVRVAELALVYSTAEYCCPVWKNSTHVNKMDAQLHTTLRIITGTLKSTPIP
jgi:hypothetical protein